MARTTQKDAGSAVSIVLALSNKTRFAAFLLCLSCSLCAQAQTPAPSFEVATVKPVIIDAAHPFDGRHFWAHISRDHASYWSMTPSDLIAYAYNVESFQVAGPQLATAEHFDIEAKFPDGATREDERRMLQALLKDRFQLTFHVEQRQLDGYVLLVGKHGANLRTADSPAAPQPTPPNGPDEKPKSLVTKNPDGSTTANLGRAGMQTMRFDREIWALHWEESRITMAQFADKLSICVGPGRHKVLDKTGLDGTYHLAFDCPSSAPRPRTPADEAAGTPSTPQDTAVLTQSLDALGLLLEKRKLSQDVYVIDHLQEPSPN